MANKRTIQQVYRRWQTGQGPPTNSPGTPRLTGEYTTGRGRLAETPLASPRPTQIARTGRWVSFGRLYRSNPPARGTSPMSMPREFERGDSAGAFSTPDSSIAPTESEASNLGRMQALEIESPLAVAESTSFAFAPWVLELVGSYFLFKLLQWTHLLPRISPDIERGIEIIDRWLRPKLVHKMVSGTPQPKAFCRPGVPNSFTTAAGTPIASSA